MSAVVKTTESDTTLPNSHRVYVNGTHAGVRVPFREISQSPSRNFVVELRVGRPL